MFTYLLILQEKKKGCEIQASFVRTGDRLKLWKHVSNAGEI